MPRSIYRRPPVDGSGVEKRSRSQELPGSRATWGQQMRRPINIGGAPMSIDKDDTDALRNAVQLLEHPSLAARLTNMVGKPVELLGRALPAGASQAIAAATTKSLEAALKVALLTIRNESQESSQLLHRALAVASGAAGGAFGIFSLPLELPVSTIIILRSILDIARSEGENLTDPESTLSCVEVLGLGGRTET